MVGQVDDPHAAILACRARAEKPSGFSARRSASRGFEGGETEDRDEAPVGAKLIVGFATAPESNSRIAAACVGTCTSKVFHHAIGRGHRSRCPPRRLERRYGAHGFASEYDVERKFRETRLYAVAPVSNNLILA
jgi:hypothetical protein